MLFKKGNKDDPLNYRPISLLSTLLKLFTTLLQARLSAWAEESNVIPPCQMGFRKGKGCVEQIFNLQSLLEIGTRRNRVYTVFIDFKRAFPSIMQHKLWPKLHAIGVPGKTIRILKKIYDGAYTRIRMGDVNSDKIKITEGFYKGSPSALFSLTYSYQILRTEFCIAKSQV